MKTYICITFLTFLKQTHLVIIFNPHNCYHPYFGDNLRLRVRTAQYQIWTIILAGLLNSELENFDSNHDCGFLEQQPLPLEYVSSSLPCYSRPSCMWTSSWSCEKTCSVFFRCTLCCHIFAHDIYSFGGNFISFFTRWNTTPALKDKSFFPSHSQSLRTKF